MQHLDQFNKVLEGELTVGLRYEWADETHLIMNLYMEAPWTWDEFHATSKEVYGILGKLDTPCATVVNIQKMGQIPKGNVLAHLGQLERTIPSNVFMSALVGAPYAATVFMNMFTKLRPRAKQITAFCLTMDEAHALIRKRHQENQTLSSKAKLR
jgi:hypothetical protein